MHNDDDGGDALTAPGDIERTTPDCAPDPEWLARRLTTHRDGRSIALDLRSLEGSAPPEVKHDFDVIQRRWPAL